MPANSKKTDIRLMRGSTIASESWVPNSGEPLVDLESMTFNIGDGVTVGGIPINTVTCHELEGKHNLNMLLTYGRFFITEIENGPEDVLSKSKVFLTVQTSDINSPEIWQSLQVLDGVFAANIFTRVSIDGGKVWSAWKRISGRDGFSDVETGTSTGDTNLNNYTFTSQVYIKKIVNGPTGTGNCNAKCVAL